LLVSVGALVLLVSTVAEGAPWRIEATPTGPMESGLRACVVEKAPSDPPDVPCLLSVSSRYPGTATAGLARLAAGLELLAEDRPDEAAAQLGHPDVAATPLRDYALLAAARAEEAREHLEEAGRLYLAAASEPDSAVACLALPGAADALRATDRNDAAAAALEEELARCPGDGPGTLASLAAVHLARKDRKAAAAALDRLDRDYPTSSEARQARAQLRALAKYLPPEAPGDRAERLLRQGEALWEAHRSREARDALRAIHLRALPPDEADHARVLHGRAAFATRHRSEARAALKGVGPASPYAGEAAFLLARDEAERRDSVEPYRVVADSFAGTPWGEEALRAAGNFFQKDALDDEALPWYRRQLADYPHGQHVEQAAWRVGWADIRLKRFAEAAQTLERTARLRPPSQWTAGFLYWAARARLALGQNERARHLLGETVQRYKHAYHGLRALEELARLGLPEPPAPPAVEAAPTDPPLPEAAVERVRELLLIDAFEQAAIELRRLGDSTLVRSTLAWVEWREGRFLPAIITLKRAHPEWLSEAGDRLPEEMWHILFPIRYEDELRRQAADKGLDASLVAALILQESSFDTAALSRAGARGLMQVMPTTGRTIARAKGVRFRRAGLHDPATSLYFGTHYLRQMSDRFDGDVEKVLAAYNAGPHRVDAWLAQRPGLSGEDFIESIPFSQTRQYVMLVLANREHYRQLYHLDRRLPGPVVEGPRP
jgi:soluble lytic murein transglycosylase